jgi:Major Facilitator Superfamily/Cyclic nucleotide-binding domain
VSSLADPGTQRLHAAPRPSRRRGRLEAATRRPGVGAPSTNTIPHNLLVETVPVRLTLLVSRIRQAFAALRVAARNEDIRRAQLAWGASISAEWAHFVALGVFAYDHGGSTAVGIAGLMRLLPAAAIAPFASSLGDRFRRERFLVGVVLLGSAALVVSAAGALMDDRIVVFAAGSAVGVCSTLFRPALIALLPSLARTARELIAANGATSTIESLGTLLGPLGAGVLVALADVGAVFAVGAAVLLASAGLLARVSVPGHVPAPASGSRVEVWRGFKAIGEVPSARLLVGLIASQTFVRGCLNVLIVVIAYQVLHGGATEVGYLAAAIGAGGLVGALGAVSLRGDRLVPPFAWALVFWGVPIMLIAPFPYRPAVILLLAVIGAANSVVDVSGFTLLQRTVADEVLTRVLGVTWGLAMGTAAIGSFVAPAVLSLIGLKPALLVVGAILPVLVLVTHRRLMEIDSDVAPASQLGLIESVAVFTPLSLVAKERIASHLVQVDVASGDIVIRAGEIGDRFYVVADGRLTIDTGSQSVRVGPGDFFGEIALLRDVPRTATVQANSDARLFALERDDFLAVVTGNSLAGREAHAVATQRLEENAAAAERLDGG